MCYSAMYGGRSGRAKGKAPKGKKSKCTLCDAKGHTAADCPDKDEMAKQAALKTPLGFGKTHKTSRKASARGSNKADDGGLTASGAATGAEGMANLLAEMFPQEEIDVDPFYFWDAGCDVGASLDSLATLHGSGKKGKTALTSVLSGDRGIIPTNYGGSLCRAVIKPDKAWDPEAPRISMILEADPLAQFVVGLGPGFLNDLAGNEDDGDPTDEDDTTNKKDQHLSEPVAASLESAATALVATLDADPERVVGLYYKLDYSPETVLLHGYDMTTQLHRFRATCMAALRANVPVQCRIAPGAPSTTSTADNESDDEGTAAAYVQVIKDLAKVLLEMSPSGDSSEGKPTLRVHLSCWNGTEAHMLHLLKAFPDTLYIGMNATAGFTKSKLAHECAFAVPINRLLLESDAPLAIPAPVVAAMGRKAFCHSGCIPFVAAAIAEHKRGSVSAVEVARAAAHNTLGLYASRGGMAQRAEQAKVEAEARAVLLAEQKLLEEEEAAAERGGDGGDSTDEDELLAQQMLEELAAMEMDSK